MKHVSSERDLVIQRLQEAGIARKSDIADLANNPTVLTEAAPALASLLPDLSGHDLKTDIVRLLARTDVSAAPLIEELRRLRSDIRADSKASDSLGDMSPAQLVEELARIRSGSTGASALAVAIADSLSSLARPSDFSSLAEIPRDPGYGEARQMIPYALAQLHACRWNVVPLLISVVDDPDVGPQAIDALRKMNAMQVIETVRARTKSRDAAVRREAKRAVKDLEARRVRRQTPAGRERRSAAAPVVGTTTSTNFDLHSFEAFLRRLGTSLAHAAREGSIHDIVTLVEALQPGEQAEFVIADVVLRVYMCDERAVDVEFWGGDAQIDIVERELARSG